MSLDDFINDDDLKESSSSTTDSLPANDVDMYDKSPPVRDWEKIHNQYKVKDSEDCDILVIQSDEDSKKAVASKLFVDIEQWR